MPTNKSESRSQSYQDYDPLECPICEKERKPSSINSDGSATYICRVDSKWQEGKPLYATHSETYSWRINTEGELAEKQGSRWVAV